MQYPLSQQRWPKPTSLSQLYSECWKVASGRNTVAPFHSNLPLNLYEIGRIVIAKYWADCWNRLMFQNTGIVTLPITYRILDTDCHSRRETALITLLHVNSKLGMTLWRRVHKHFIVLPLSEDISFNRWPHDRQRNYNCNMIIFKYQSMAYFRLDWSWPTLD